MLTFVNLMIFLVVLKITKMIEIDSRDDISINYKEDGLNIMEIFTKSMKVTEEEVSISKEKKICIVCKGKVQRNNIYLCPDCNTFYCQKCSNSLIDLENACWVCDTVIDESRPVKVSAKIKEIELEKNEHKKSN